MENEILNNTETIKILWTGGWDSTYNLVEKSRKPVTIQPIYVSDDGRINESFERKAMDEILKVISAKEETKATILPVEFIDKNVIPPNKEITEAFNIIHEKTNLGTQHEWLARLTYQYKDIEIGTEAGDVSCSRILSAIDKFCKLVQSESKEYYYVDLQKSTREGALVFGNFRFPIIDKTELDMRNNIEDWGYQDVMNLIWFCHWPVWGKPCGLCHPCEVKIESNMEQLLSETALKRYKRKNKFPFRFFFRVILKINREKLKKHMQSERNK